MEVPKKEARFLQKIRFQRNCLMEAPQEEAVPLQVRSLFAKSSASEKEPCMEAEKEKSPFSEVAFRCVRLGPQHRFSFQAPRKPAVFWPGVCERVASMDSMATLSYDIDIIYC